MSVKEVRLEMISLQEKSQIIGLHIKGKSNRKIALGAAARQHHIRDVSHKLHVALIR